MIRAADRSRVAPPSTVHDTERPLHIRWLGTVEYREALALQRAVFSRGRDHHLLLLEHPHVFTLGARADRAHILGDPAEMGADVVPVDRGGDVTYHGPGQLVGYPLLTVPGHRGGGMADSHAHVHTIEQLLIDVLADLGLDDTGRLDRRPGVWVGPDSESPRKIAAVGVRVTRGRSLHGFALNVDPDMAYFDAIVPCGIADLGVTSLRAEGVHASMAAVVDAVAARAAAAWGTHGCEREDVAWRVRPTDLSAFTRGEGPGSPVLPGRADPAAPPPAAASGVPVRLSGRLARAGVGDGIDIATRKPDWMRVKAEMGPEYRRIRRVVKQLELATVCEEAGCPNIFECWNDGTATFMILGERCTRACGFCLVDTRKPGPVDGDEPARVAEAAVTMGLTHVVVTMVARDDLPDGGSAAVAATIRALRDRAPSARVEVLISDLRGRHDALDAVLDAGPDVVAHNIETVPRLQRAVRPSAGYARSLGVLAHAGLRGATTKSSIIVGMGETLDEVIATMADLAAIGVDIVTVGQYLRPTTHHVPVDRWWHPDEFAAIARLGEELGIGHVEAGPLTRSSYHARQAADAAGLEAGTAPEVP